MVELDDFKTTLNTYKEPLEEVKGSLSLKDKTERIEELERLMEEPGFWDNADKASKDMKELKDLKEIVESSAALTTSYEDIFTLIDMAYEENDKEMIPEIGDEINAFITKFENLRVSTLLSDEYDRGNAI